MIKQLSLAAVGAVLALPMLAFLPTPVDAANYKQGIKNCQQVKAINVSGVKWALMLSTQTISTVAHAKSAIRVSPFCRLKKSTGNHYTLHHYDSDGNRHADNSHGLHGLWKSKAHFNNTAMTWIANHCQLPKDFADGTTSSITRKWTAGRNTGKTCAIMILPTGKLHSQGITGG